MWRAYYGQGDLPVVRTNLYMAQRSMCLSEATEGLLALRILAYAQNLAGLLNCLSLRYEQGSVKKICARLESRQHVEHLPIAVSKTEEHH